MKFAKSKLLMAWLAGALWVASSLCAAVARPPSPPEVGKLFDAGSYRSAVSSLESATHAEPDNAALRYWLGRCFYELHDYGHAFSSFERAVDLDPNLASYHDWLGRASGRKAEAGSHGIAAVFSLSLARRAEREFSEAVRLDPNDVDAERDLIHFLTNAPSTRSRPTWPPPSCF